MYKTVSIIGGDLRIVNFIDLLAKDDFLIYTYGLENSEDLEEKENIKRCASLAELVGSSEIIIGPLPMTNDSQNISAPFSDEKIPIDELITEMSNKNKMFFAGKLSEKTIEKLQEGNIKYIDLLKREELVVLNTIATAEGTIQIAIENTNTILHGSNCLILGFGRIGKVLARKLVGLSVNVTCAARKDDDIAWIQAYGYKSLNINELGEELNQYDIIINTVPHIVLNEKRLEYVRNDALLIDLASNPGGIDKKSVKDKKLKFIWALSLPGKVAPITSAEFIKNTIYNIIKK